MGKWSLKVLLSGNVKILSEDTCNFKIITQSIVKECQKQILKQWERNRITETLA